jgi:hypothetical protein
MSTASFIKLARKAFQKPVALQKPWRGSVYPFDIIALFPVSHVDLGVLWKKLMVPLVGTLRTPRLQIGVLR